MKKVNIALIGLGPVGEFNHLPILYNNKKINLIAVCDKDKSKLNSISQKYKMNTYLNFKRMIDENKLDIIVLSSSLTTLFEISKYILNKKINLLCEKPMCINYRQAIILNKIAQKNKTKCMIGFMKIYDPCTIMLKKLLLKHNKIKKVEYFSYAGKAFKQKFKSKDKFKNTNQVNKNIKLKKEYLKFINTHSHGIRTLIYLLGKIRFKNSIKIKNEIQVNFQKKFPISFNSGYKFSKIWNEKIIFHYKKLKIILKFESNNIRSKKSILYKIYKNKRIDYNLNKSYSFETQINKMISEKKSINDINNIFNLFNFYEKIFINL